MRKTNHAGSVARKDVRLDNACSTADSGNRGLVLGWKTDGTAIMVVENVALGPQFAFLNEFRFLAVRVVVFTIGTFVCSAICSPAGKPRVNEDHPYDSQTTYYDALSVKFVVAIYSVAYGMNNASALVELAGMSLKWSPGFSMMRDPARSPNL